MEATNAGKKYTSEDLEAQSPATESLSPITRLSAVRWHFKLAGQQVTSARAGENPALGDQKTSTPDIRGKSVILSRLPSPWKFKSLSSSAPRWPQAGPLEERNSWRPLTPCGGVRSRSPFLTAFHGVLARR